MANDGPRVLLVDVDEAPLYAVADALRARGFTILCASTVARACEIAQGGVDAVVATRRMVEDASSGLGLVDAMALETPSPPPFVIWGDEWSEGAAAELDEKLRALVPHVARAPAAPERVRLMLGVEPLLRRLATEQASGTVSVHTPRASGEIRVASGRVADAVHGRVDGIKALGRLLDEREGTATFVRSAAEVVSRVDRTVDEVLGAVAEERAQVARLRAELQLEAADVLLLADGAGQGPSDDDASRAVLARLRLPVTLDDLLDELPIADDAILAVVVGLSRSGNLKRLGRASSRAQVADVDSLAELKGLAARLRAPGFSGPARLVLAAMHARIGVLAQAASALADAVPSGQPAPSVPSPYVVGVVRFGDGVDLELLALPLVPAYSPLWAPALAGAGLVVQIDEAASGLLEDACRSLEIPIASARDLAPGGEDMTPERLATLVRSALQAGAGA